MSDNRATEDLAGRVAAMLAGLRTSHKTTRHSAQHAGVAEALLWIASGVDHLSDLVQVSGMSKSEAWRCVALLDGRGIVRRGQVLHCAYRLVERREHPHRRGQQIVLSPAGVELINATFSNS